MEDGSDPMQAVDLVNSEELLKLLDASGGEAALLVLTGDPINGTGTGCGIYDAGDFGRTGQAAIYYGDYAVSVRSGRGIWITEAGVYGGDWADDAPNGEGEFTNTANCSEEGPVKDGKWNGRILSIGIDPARDRGHIQCVEGVPVVQAMGEDLWPDDPDAWGPVISEELDYALVLTEGEDDSRSARVRR